MNTRRGGAVSVNCAVKLTPRGAIHKLNCGGQPALTFDCATCKRAARSTIITWLGANSDICRTIHLVDAEPWYDPYTRRIALKSRIVSCTSRPTQVSLSSIFFINNSSAIAQDPAYHQVSTFACPVRIIFLWLCTVPPPTFLFRLHDSKLP